MVIFQNIWLSHWVGCLCLVASLLPDSALPDNYPKEDTGGRERESQLTRETKQAALGSALLLLCPRLSNAGEGWGGGSQPGLAGSAVHSPSREVFELVKPGWQNHFGAPELLHRIQDLRIEGGLDSGKFTGAEFGSAGIAPNPN